MIDLHRSSCGWTLLTDSNYPSNLSPAASFQVSSICSTTYLMPAQNLYVGSYSESVLSGYVCGRDTFSFHGLT